MMGDRNEPGVVPLAIDELFQYIHDVSARSVPVTEWNRRCKRVSDFYTELTRSHNR